MKQHLQQPNHAATWAALIGSSDSSSSGSSVHESRSGTTHFARHVWCTAASACAGNYSIIENREEVKKKTSSSPNSSKSTIRPNAKGKIIIIGDSENKLSNEVRHKPKIKTQLKNLKGQEPFGCVVQIRSNSNFRQIVAQSFGANSGS